MKKLIITCVLMAVTFACRAQWLTPEAVNGALMGTVIGGIAGGNCNDGFSGNGAAIGAGIGLAVGAIAGEARQQNQYNSQPVVYQPAPVAVPGYGYTAPYVYYPPNNPQPRRPNYAVGGTLLGAASGALIGQGSGSAGEGAAIGAGAGLLLGGIAEYAARKKQQKATKAYAAPAPQPPQVQYHQPTPSEITSKPAPNSTYYWTSPPRQIPDAPRVPDAPTF